MSNTSVTTEWSSNLFCSINSFNVLDDYFETSQCCTPIVIGTLTTQAASFSLKKAICIFLLERFCIAACSKDTKCTLFKVHILDFVLLNNLVRISISAINMKKNVTTIQGALDIIVCWNLGIFCVNLLLHGGD